MTDTGSIPGQGQPENSSGTRPATADEQQGAAAPADFGFPGPSGGSTEDDDLFYLPGAQGAWSDPQLASGRPASDRPDRPASGGPRAETPTPGRPASEGASPAPQQAGRQGAPAAARRPLHLGPPVPEASSGGVVRSLADRGPAAPPAEPAAPAHTPVPATTVPARPDMSYVEADALPGPQLGTIPSAPAGWHEAPRVGQAETVERPASARGESAADHSTPASAAASAAPQAVADRGPAMTPQTAEGVAPATPDRVDQPVATTPRTGTTPEPEGAPVTETVPNGEERAEAGAAAVPGQAAPAAAETQRTTEPPATNRPATPGDGETKLPADGEPTAESGGPAMPVPADAATAVIARATEVTPAENGDPAGAGPRTARPEPTPAQAVVGGDAVRPADRSEAAAESDVAEPAPTVGGHADESGDPESPGAVDGSAAADPRTGGPASAENDSSAQARRQPSTPGLVPAPSAGGPKATEGVVNGRPAVPPEVVRQVPAEPAPTAGERTAGVGGSAVPGQVDAAAAVHASRNTDPAPTAPAAEADGPAPAPGAGQNLVTVGSRDAAERANGHAGVTRPASAPVAMAESALAADRDAAMPHPATEAGSAAPDAAVTELSEARTDGSAPRNEDSPVREGKTQPGGTEAFDAEARVGDAPVPGGPVPAQAADEGDPAGRTGRAPDVAEPDAASDVEADPVAADTAAAPVDKPAHSVPTPAADVPQSAPVGEVLTAPAEGFDEAGRAAVHRVMHERRDIRKGFRPDPVPHDVLLRVLEAAHTAPSVDHSQPWDFVVIRSEETRRRIHQLVQRQRDAYAQSLPKGRAKQFKELRIEAILDTPVNIVVTADPTRGGGHAIGRHTQPGMAPYSSALAVENLWLAARAEGLGVGWVSFFDERELVRDLDLPEHLDIVAYLCLGYVDEFPDEPELVRSGWSQSRPLSWVVHEESYGRRALPGEEPHDLLAATLKGIRPLDAKALGEAWERQKRMTKPPGSLGMLEIISAQLCGLSRTCPPPVPEPAAVAIFAGDHGVHAQGVTNWPQEVTAQMVANFLGGGAVCNAFANQVGAEVCVVDVGVVGELTATPGLVPRKVRHGTSDMTTGPALTREDVLRAIEVGIETARDLVAAGNKALLTGEMGIANTTASAAIIAVCTATDPAEVTGRGTGINDDTHARKVEIVRRAIEVNRPDAADPIGVLAAVGGLEHAALVGFILGGSSLRTPVILDGVSAGAAALLARAIAPESLSACVAGHRSPEPGHAAALTRLGLRPMIELDLRLGEGTGALLALPVVQSAARAMHEVATFDTAGVTEKN